MGNFIMQTIQKLHVNRKRRKTWQRLVRALGLLVVFCTTYALILPAITMQAEPICGLEAHTHTDACYKKQSTHGLSCQLPEGVTVLHKHGDLCTDAAGNRVCTLQELEEHSHDDSCYTLTQTLSCPVMHVHSDQCVKTESVKVCTLEEAPAHSHSDSCGGSRQELVCGLEENGEHRHSESCYTLVTVPCELAEGEGHSHGPGCYSLQEIPCTQPVVESHEHEDSCYTQTKTLSCRRQEIALHSHGDACYDDQGKLLCEKEQVIAHEHSEACLVDDGQEKLLVICGLAEHSHGDACYPVREQDEAVLKYRCGYSQHNHDEFCHAADGSKTCTVPEHSHTAGCVLEGLDLTADVETAAQWEAALAELEYTGDWSADLLLVARSQLGYRESAVNCILADNQLKGYTRYGAWYGNPYADWDALFVSFCLNYAEINRENIPYESDAGHWVRELTAWGMYAPAASYLPKAGDLVFLDTDEDEIADRVGIAAELLPENRLQILAGDGKDGSVAYEDYSLAGDGILGYGKLPGNPLSREQWLEAVTLADKLTALPTADAVKDSFRALNRGGDKAGHEALRQELMSRIGELRSAYQVLTDGQKALVGSLDILDELEKVCGGENWQQFPSLSDDSAVISQLSVLGAERIPAPAAETAGTETGGEGEDSLPADAMHNQDVIVYTFSASAQSYFSDLSFGEGRMKLELLLPLSGDKAQFDTAAMGWLEDSVLSHELREINGKQIICQVLSGYMRLSGSDGNAIAIPGDFSRTIAVKAINMRHGEELFVLISAAMEHGTWDGLCPEHQVEEKLSVQTQTFILDKPLSDQERDAWYRSYLSQIQGIAGLGLSLEESRPMGEYLLGQVVEAYYNGQLSLEELGMLGEALRPLFGYHSEFASGTGWMLGGGSVMMSASPYTLSRSLSVAQSTALPASVSRNLFPSDVQIPEGRHGGGIASDDGAVYVSKTIQGTELENVFDITLDIVTQDEVNEVYREPDMAVVVVMDISQTMNSSFGGTTRYQAAMDAGEAFMKNFANYTSGLSKLGYVAFNTHAHEIFDMSPCGTTAQVTALAKKMRNATSPIINASGYASSHNRFTNIDAGLKMANDMLKDVKNQHKYIILISDGFPTTYVQSGYTGWDPYTSSGSNGTNGVFYDEVRNVHCDYGTSYSDTAAIKARERAVKLKNDGVNIFSIGVDVAGQTIKYYHDSYYDADGNAKGFSVVERRKEASYYNTNGYEIGTKHSAITKKNPTADEKADMAQDFKDWLKGSKTSGIGSGYYYDSTDTAGLNSAYEQIFAQIQEINSSSSHLDWVATDPMPDMGLHDLETMEFIGFWAVNDRLQSSLTGESKVGEEYENSASFDTDTSTIRWDLKKSRYITTQMGDTTNYRMWLKYRVRLKNENEGFVERQIYDTNDVTTLTYRVIETVNNVTSISERRSIDFPIPAVEGYLSELNFKKTGPDDVPLVGAEFTLSHSDQCGICRGDGSAVPLEPMKAKSGNDGMVSFVNVPSGHRYTLTETKVPDGYVATRNTYDVTVSYDTLTVTVTDANGEPLEWTQSIENSKYYVLPHTGGRGPQPYILAGLLLLGLSLVCLGRQRSRQRRGGTHANS